MKILVVGQGGTRTHARLETRTEPTRKKNLMRPR